MGIKTQEEIITMRQGGKILATVLKEVAQKAVPGVSTIELDRAAEALILSHGAQPAFKGYEKFPYSLCTSVNEDIVHGYPSTYQLKEGDVVKLDLGVLYKGYNTDMAVTVAVGKVTPEAKKLIEATKKSLAEGIKKVKPGNTIGDIGHAVQSYLEKRGYGVVRDLVGHGIGRQVHEEPSVPNYGTAGNGEVLQEGMVICIEPMVTVGDYKIIKSKDGYGYATRDGSLSAHFENTVAVTKRGAEILTRT